MPESGTSAAKVEGLPVKVWGMGSDGKPFSVTALASELSPHGARLDGVNSIKSVGEIVGVQYQEQKARFRVVWIGPEGTPTDQIGVRALEPENCIWQQALPSALQQERLVGFTVAGVQQRERRQHVRYRIPGNVGFLALGCDRSTWGKLVDLSLGGCYVEVAMPAPKSSKVELRVQAQGMEFAVSGEVRTSVTGLGMGVEFTAFKGDARQRLQGILSKAGPKLFGKTSPHTEPTTQTNNPSNSGLALEVPGLQAAEVPVPVTIQPSGQKSVCDPAKFLASMRDFFSENDLLTIEEFRRFLEQSKVPDPE